MGFGLQIQLMTLLMPQMHNLLFFSSMPMNVQQSQHWMQFQKLSQQRSLSYSQFMNLIQKISHFDLKENQIRTYVQMKTVKDEDCLPCWGRHWLTFNRLYHLALHALYVPASSAPIKHVFSQEDLIMRPNRASLTDVKLSLLLFLKRNKIKR